MTYIHWMTDAGEVAPLGHVWETQMWWCACSEQLQRWLETLRLWANKGWSHLWGNRVLVVTLHRHLLGEGARRHRVKDRDSGSQVKAKVDSFIEGTGRPLIHSTSQALIGSGCWLCCILSLIGFSSHVSLHQQSLGLVAGPTMVQGGSSVSTCSCRLVWAGLFGYDHWNLLSIGSDGLMIASKVVAHSATQAWASVLFSGSCNHLFRERNTSLGEAGS